MRRRSQSITNMRMPNMVPMKFWSWGKARYREQSDQTKLGLQRCSRSPSDMCRDPNMGLPMECSPAWAISALRAPDCETTVYDERQIGRLYGNLSPELSSG